MCTERQYAERNENMKHTERYMEESKTQSILAVDDKKNSKTFDSVSLINVCLINSILNETFPKDK